MKKLIALLLVIVFCFSSCDVINSIIGELPSGGDLSNELPDDAEITDEGESESPTHRHNYTSERTAPTCTAEGYITYTCECGRSYVTEKTAALGHSYYDGACTYCGALDPNPDSGDNGDSGSDCDTHADVNNDGYCDYCRDSVIVIVDIYAINDLHGKVNASDSQPGLGPLTTYLKTVMNENTILLSTGDMWQGSSESNLTYGALVTDWMSEMGFVSMTLGNHEYDWGESYISANASIAEFPLLAINVYDKTTGKRAEYATPSVVVSRGGVEIGIIGAIGDCYSSISGDVSGGFEFKTGNELASLVKAESDRLRDMGVDFIVYTLHDGYGSSSSGVKNVSNSAIASYYQSVLSDGYVDLVFEAHTHQSYILLDNGGVYHLQGGGENKGLSYAAISINSANGNTKVTNTSIISQSKYQNLSDDELVDRLLEEYAEDISGAYEVLGNNRKYRDDSEVEQLVADLYYEFGIAKWGQEYDIVLGGGFIRTRNPYNLYAGETTYSDIYSLLPFDNELVLCSIKGSDLKSKFINTSNSDYYICYGSYNISSIKDNEIYYIVTDTYTSTYAPNRLTEVARASEGIYARDLVADFIRKGGWA